MLRVIARTFIEENQIRFMAVRSEDKFFNNHVCRVAKTVTCISGTPYCYRKDDQPSITKTFNRKTIDSFFGLFRLLELMADEEPRDYYDSLISVNSAVLSIIAVCL